MVSEDDDASTDGQSSSCSCASARLVDPPARRLVLLTVSADWLTVTVPHVTGRKRRLSVHHLSSTTCCRSELRGVDDRALSFCTGSDADHLLSFCTGIVDDHVRLFWPTLLMNMCGEYDEPRGPRGRATDRWRWHLSSTTTTDSRRHRSQRPHCWRVAGRWLWWMVMVTDEGHHQRLLSLMPIAKILSLK